MKENVKENVMPNPRRYTPLENFGNLDRVLNFQTPPHTGITLQLKDTSLDHDYLKMLYYCHNKQLMLHGQYQGDISI